MKNFNIIEGEDIPLVENDKIVLTDTVAIEAFNEFNKLIEKKSISKGDVISLEKAIGVEAITTKVNVNNFTTMRSSVAVSSAKSAITNVSIGESISTVVTGADYLILGAEVSAWLGKTISLLNSLTSDYDGKNLDNILSDRYAYMYNNSDLELIVYPEDELVDIRKISFLKYISNFCDNTSSFHGLFDTENRHRLDILIELSRDEEYYRIFNTFFYTLLHFRDNEKVDTDYYDFNFKILTYGVVTFEDMVGMLTNIEESIIKPLTEISKKLDSYTKHIIYEDVDLHSSYDLLVNLLALLQTEDLFIVLRGLKRT